MRTSALLVALLLVPVLAGCSQTPSTPLAAPAAPGLSASGPGAATANATAPVWKVGQYWIHKWTLVSSNLTFLVKAVVAQDDGDAWTLATDNQTNAAFHGAFVFPTLGQFSKRDLNQAVGELGFPWYRFPLAANATWNGTQTFLTDSGKLASSAVQGRVVSVMRGAQDLYRIDLTRSGRLVAQYDYDTGTQWFDRALFYDANGTLLFRVEMQETGKGFHGRAYDDTGVLLATAVDLLVPAGQVVQPNPTSTFTMGHEHNRLLAFLISFAGAGFHDTEIVAPDGTRYGAQAIDAAQPSPLYDDSRALLAPGVAGDWRITMEGVGAFASGGVVLAYGITEKAIDV
jgi:hypothetical protein